jgi:2-methylcitrate dehydratase PrpD
MQHGSAQSLDRRLFLAAGGAALLAAPGATWAESETRPSGGAAETRRLSEAIAAFVTGFDLKNVPPVAVERARIAFVDTIGVMLAGSRQPAAEIVCDMVRSEASSPAAAIVGQWLQASPQLAAMANAVAAHDMDYDLTYLIGQMVAPIIPALLPLAESVGATPAETLAAFMVGFEVSSRFGRAGPQLASGGGWHSAGTIGVIGTAAACARLLKLPASAIPDVLGIAVSMAGGVGANYGTMTKALHSGMAARNGVVAALLGASGFTSNPAAIEGRDGFFGNFLRGLDTHLEAFNDLGSSYDLAERGFRLKLYPCGGQTHTAIDSALKLRDTLGVRLADVLAIKVGVTKYGAKRASSNYPVSIENAKFSMPYLVAYSLVHGAPLLPAFTEEALRDDKVRAFARNVSVTVDAEFADVIDEAPSRLVVTFTDRRTQELVRTAASGSPKFPLTKAQIEAKFFACAEQTIERDAAESILATLNTLGEQPSFKEFWPLLRRA